MVVVFAGARVVDDVVEDAGTVEVDVGARVVDGADVGTTEGGVSDVDVTVDAAASVVDEADVVLEVADVVGPPVGTHAANSTATAAMRVTSDLMA